MAITTTPASFVAPVLSIIAGADKHLTGDEKVALMLERRELLTLSTDPGHFWLVEVQTGEFYGVRDDSPVCDGYWFLDEASALLWASLKENIQPYTDAGRTRVTRCQSRKSQKGWLPGGERWEQKIIKNYW